MTIDETVVLLMGALVFLIAGKLPRARLWVCAITVVYFFSNWVWSSSGWSNPAYIAAILDALLVVEILRSTNSKKERWQFCTAIIMQLMVAVNLIYVYFGHILNVGVYHQISLEALNYAALLVIGGTAVSEKLGHVRTNPLSHNFNNIRAFMRAVLPQNRTNKGT